MVATELGLERLQRERRWWGASQENRPKRAWAQQCSPWEPRVQGAGGTPLSEGGGGGL